MALLGQWQWCRLWWWRECWSYRRWGCASLSQQYKYQYFCVPKKSIVQIPTCWKSVQNTSTYEKPKHYLAWCVTNRIVALSTINGNMYSYLNKEPLAKVLHMSINPMTDGTRLWSRSSPTSYRERRAQERGCHSLHIFYKLNDKPPPPVPICHVRLKDAHGEHWMIRNKFMQERHVLPEHCLEIQPCL